MRQVTYASLTSGVTFLLIQNTFYGYVDEEGFVHDSLFLPLGSILILVGMGLFTTGLLRKS